MEFSEVVRIRQSVRAFKPEQITEEQLNAVLTAAQNAPTAMGKCEDLQLVVVQDAVVLEQLNTAFAGIVGNPEAKPTYGAPTVIYVIAPKEREDILLGANAGVMVEQMLLAAVDQGLGGVYLFGVSQALQGSPVPAEVLGLPEGWRTVSAAAIGYPAEPVAAREVGERYQISRV